jgi:hypothetical protein
MFVVQSACSKPLGLNAYYASFLVMPSKWGHPGIQEARVSTAHVTKHLTHDLCVALTLFSELLVFDPVFATVFPMCKELVLN